MFEKISDRIKELFDKLVESLNEQTWFQQLKTKWEELDPQSKQYLKFAGFGGTVLGSILFVLSAMWSVHSLKKELSDKRDLLNLIQSANDELRYLRESMPAAASSDGEGETGNWSSYFQSVAQNSGLDKSSLNIGTEKSGASNDSMKETLYDVNLKHVNLKQLMRYAFNLENGQRPVKIRNLLVETKSDPSGYLDANFAVSVFTQVVNQ